MSGTALTASSLETQAKLETYFQHVGTPAESLESAEQHISRCIWCQAYFTKRIGDHASLRALTRQAHE